MHKNLLFTLFCCSVGNIFSQSFTVYPDNEVVTYTPLNTYTTATMKFRNDTQENLIFGWQLLDKTSPEGWDYSYCDFNTCYSASDYNGVMAPVIPGDSGFVKVNVLTQNEGWSRFKIRVFNFNEPGDADTVQFWFNGLAGSIESVEKNDLSIYPNPVNLNGKMTLDNLPDNAHVSVINTLGQTVFSAEITKKSINVEIDWKKGIYFVNIKGEGFEEIRKIIVR